MSSLLGLWDAVRRVPIGLTEGARFHTGNCIRPRAFLRASRPVASRCSASGKAKDSSQRPRTLAKGAPTISNGRVYFGNQDGNLYAFGANYFGLTFGAKYFG